MRIDTKIILIAASSLWLAACADDDGTVVLAASHQWPLGDIRDEMVQIIARETAAADVGVEIRIYPGEALLKARDQWAALVSGRVDMIALPLDYASGRHPQFSATLMPGLVRDYAHARRLNDSPFMAEIHSVIEQAGAVVLADAWIAGGIVSTRGCVLEPADIRSQVTRAAGPMFERMLAAAGASITSMPSSEIYTGLQTGVLDAAITSSASFDSYRIYEQVACYTAPGENTIWFMYEPVMISKRTWDGLDEAQRAALRAAARSAEDYFDAAAASLDADAEAAFVAAGVEVVHLSEAQLRSWTAIAAESSYASFAEEVAGGRELLDLASAVE